LHINLISKGEGELIKGPYTYIITTCVASHCVATSSFEVLKLLVAAHSSFLCSGWSPLRHDFTTYRGGSFVSV